MRTHTQTDIYMQTYCDIPTKTTSMRYRQYQLKKDPEPPSQLLRLAIQSSPFLRLEIMAFVWGELQNIERLIKNDRDDHNHGPRLRSGLDSDQAIFIAVSEF